MAVAGIQETKWFGSDVWNYTLLHSGRPLPEESDPQVRNEDVCILLDKDATAAWKDAGESWEQQEAGTLRRSNSDFSARRMCVWRTTVSYHAPYWQ